MMFPPLKPGRAILWITLHPDETAADRAAALRTVLKECRLHPLDTTPAAAVVIVEEAAFQARIAAVRAALGGGDVLHLITGQPGDRLRLESITAPEASTGGLAARPPWWNG